ncbi:MAG: dicarboxylate/amino acid:cation symporter [Spirochaetes bacterium]|nr:dicarboxylate/amino acid:cation symporter [Spirochaetota bacterium]
MQEKKKLGLITRLVIGIVAGTILGMIGIQPILAITATFNLLFGQLLTFTIPLIILAFITVGISEIGKGSGKYLGLLIGGFYISTIAAAYIGYFATVITQPLIVEIGGAVLYEDARPAVPSLINLTVAPIMGVMTALVFAFILGAFIAATNKDSTLAKSFQDFRDVVMAFVIKIIVPWLPVHIGGIFARIAWQGQAQLMFLTFGRVFLMILVVHWAWILFHYFLVGSASKISPFKLLKPMMGSYFMAVGTQSSAVTLTVNLPNIKRMGVSDNAANFVAPLGATIHLPGSTISIVACTVAVMFLFDMPVNLTTITPFILGVSVAMVAAPGVPGGAIMASLGVLEMTLGFTDYQLALMIALYIAQDSFGTAVNVTSDGAAAIWLDRYMGNKTLDYKG